MLRAAGLSVAAAAHRLLDDLTLDFAPGELALVVGPNGAGKTTLLRCLSGEMTPTRGGVTLAQRALGDWPRRELARARAVLPQQSTLDFPFSVTDVVLLGRLPHRTTDAQNRAIAAATLAWCDCAALGGRDYPSLSGGEQQRVQTARVLAQIVGAEDLTAGSEPPAHPASPPSPPDSRPSTSPSPRFLLLDEPASALDLSHQYALLRLLKRLTRRHPIGVIATLHNLNLVAQFADRAIILDHGMLIADGAPIDVFTEETLGAVFNLGVSIRRHPDNATVPLIIPRLEE